MKSMFENAKSGDKFQTKDGREAIYLNHHFEEFRCYEENGINHKLWVKDNNNAVWYYDNGKADCPNEGFDIVAPMPQKREAIHWGELSDDEKIALLGEILIANPKELNYIERYIKNYALGEEFFALHNNEVHTYTLGKIEIEIEPQREFGSASYHKPPLIKAKFWSDEPNNTTRYNPYSCFDARKCFRTKKDLLNSL